MNLPTWTKLSLLIAVFSTSLLARDRRELTNWSNLSELRAGQQIEVIEMNLKRTRGRFVSFSADDLRLSTGAGAVIIPQKNVFRVTLRENSKRLRNVLIGLGVGAAAGLATGAAVDSSFSEDDENVAKMLFLPLGAGLGAAVGAAVPQFETLYRAPSGAAPRPAQGASK